MSKQKLPLAQDEPCCTPLVREPLTEDWAGDLARMFRALGDPVRLQLLSRVASHAGGEACVCDLSVGLDLTQPTISHHLKVLREAGLLQCERRGTWVYYWVVPSALAQLSAVLGSADVSASGLDSSDANTSRPRVPATVPVSAVSA
jgi:ArsR family transcriptional regulator, arsenate/arsenite/antimonite-responsive transcriptional repressor